MIGSPLLRSYLINYARSLIYTTSLSTSSLAAIKCCYTFLMSLEGDRRRSHLHDLTTLFRNLISKVPTLNLLPSDSAIHGVLIRGGNHLVVKVARELKHRGFNVLPIRSPTVPPGKERLRITIHAHNSEDEVKQLVQALELVSQNYLVGHPFISSIRSKL